ncbi:MAG: DUF2194 domain-containing protein [Clostridia bacterium]
MKHSSRVRKNGSAPRFRTRLALYVPVLCMLFLLLVILTEQKGTSFETRAAFLNYLDSPQEAENAGAPVPVYTNGPAELMILHNSSFAHETLYANQLCTTLEHAAIPYVKVDLAAGDFGSLAGVRTVLLCSQSMTPLASRVEELSAWIEEGGHFGLLMVPEQDNSFRIMSRKLGIIETSGVYEPYTSIRFLTDLLPMFQNGALHQDDSLLDTTLGVRLSGDCTVHMETGDERRLPLLWERPLGNGRVMVLNMTLTSEKANRGMYLCALFALEDTVIYPIINSSMIFVDDFPAPQPEGTDARILADYGYDIQGFFRNHWWPDMKELVWKYGVRYTGVLIETYNDIVTPPFVSDTNERALLRYYASELVHSGGEIGLHGYNHMPLCPDGFQYSNEDYNTWPSAENMAASLQELFRYGTKMLPDAHFVTYVPPSNYLSPLGQETLLKTLPQIRTISGLYLNEDDVNSLTQEFCEEADGSISVPRITYGFAMNDYLSLLTAQELLCQGVFSHFIHPDDVLDDERSGGLHWDALYAAFIETLDALKSSYPDLRYCTASEGAAAVQRYDRVRVSRQWEGTTLRLTLAPFTDEVWLALRTRDTNFTVEGGTAYPINEHFTWICAQQSDVRILWEAKP